ncbi:MAG: cytochrome c maturation protein CcmE [Chloroflexota bacterium]|nr:cytochrome c maturation protein CcmE [Dehalococcoidia bacterium]MDW8253331.1 cytochrome c maturation protein CcmE [Chloroflexota bacterium]
MLGEQSISLPAARVSPLTRYQKPVIAAVLVALAIGYLITTSLQTTAVYYHTIPEIRARQLAPNEIVRVNGWVREGTIEKFPDGSGARFLMYDSKDPSQTMVVTYRGLLPDTFVDGAEVVVQGKLIRSGTDGRPPLILASGATSDLEFEATTLLAKCPSKFEAA